MRIPDACALKTTGHMQYSSSSEPKRQPNSNDCTICVLQSILSGIRWCLGAILVSPTYVNSVTSNLSVLCGDILPGQSLAPCSALLSLRITFVRAEQVGSRFLPACELGEWFGGESNMVHSFSDVQPASAVPFAHTSHSSSVYDTVCFLSCFLRCRLGIKDSRGRWGVQAPAFGLSACPQAPGSSAPLIVLVGLVRSVLFVLNASGEVYGFL